MRFDDDNELKTDGNAAWPLITSHRRISQIYIVIIIIVAVVVFKICISASREQR